MGLEGVRIENTWTHGDGLTWKKAGNRRAKMQKPAGNGKRNGGTERECGRWRITGTDSMRQEAEHLAA